MTLNRIEKADPELSNLFKTSALIVSEMGDRWFDVEKFLNTWIMGYVVNKDDVGQDLKAEYPLREARVDVVEVAGRPGSYKATVFLRPHFMLEELSTSMRLVAELPAPAG